MIHSLCEISFNQNVSGYRVTNMHVFEQSCYRFNKRLLLLIGQWPYQDSSDRLYRMYFMNFVYFSFALPQVLLLFTSTSVLNAIIEIVPPMLALLNIMIKYYTFHIYRHNIRNVLDRIADDWKMWDSRQEMAIVKKYAQEGRLYTLAYTIYIYTALCLFWSMSFVPCLVDFVAPLNGSRSLTPIFKGEYFVNQDEHFLPIFSHTAVTMFISITSLIATDTFFLIIVSHVCGSFATVGFRLEQLLRDERLVNLPTDKKRKICIDNLRISINCHERALEFSDLIESSFSISLLLQCGMNIICMSVTLYRIAVMTDQSTEVFRYIAFITAQLFHIFCSSYSGQKMINHSSEIHFKAYCGLWYEAPIEICKLLILVIRRSYEPSYLTAGKMFVFCLESFTTIVQTSTSYFMVLSSVN